MTTPRLEDLVRDAPLVILLGPGGVGKTTVSSVMALHKAAEGNRSLVLTIDPARRLADALGVSRLPTTRSRSSPFARCILLGS